MEWLYLGFNRSEEWDGDMLVPLWALGDRLGCPLVQDDVMCDLIKYHNSYHLSVDTLALVYELSAPESIIRRFVIDQCLFDIRHVCPKMPDVGCAYLQFVKDNEDFAQELGEATILLGNEKAKDPFRNKILYLCALSPCTPKPSSGS